jgi:drug/metabolite transporter (DMT)-like permease
MSFFLYIGNLIYQKKMDSFKTTSKSNTATIAGILAVLIWSSNVAVSKRVMNDLGSYNAAFYIYFFSGVINFIILLVVLGKGKFLQYLSALPLRYYYQTGIFFVLNNVFIYSAIGLAKKDEELLIVTLLNYLWPILIFVFRVPIYRAKIIPWLFFPAIFVALAGIIIALFQGYSSQELYDIVSALDDNFLAFFFAFLGAASWALYSNLIHKYKSNDDIVAIPIIFIFSSFVFLIIQLFRGQIQSLSIVPLYTNPYLLYTILGPTCLGYLFWFLAMKHGNRNIANSLSYFIPLGSVFLISQIHSIPITPIFWLSAMLLISGAILGIKAIRE